MNNLVKHISILCCFLWLVNPMFAQQRVNETDRKDNKPVVAEEHSPKKAVLLALALPGAGQIYNKKYWKLPIVYGGLATTTYLIVFNHDKFKNFDKALTERQNGEVDKYVGIYSDQQLQDLTLDYRNERDRAVLITAGIYLLQVVDAYVDAHLFNFDVSDDLTLNISPALNYDLNTEALQTGISLNFSIR